MDYNKIEDAVMKNALDTFKQSAVEFFGIDTKIISPAKTELKNITINTNFTDYTFYTEDGNYLHFEFQTTYNKNDIKRFLFYDASLIYNEDRKVRTIVVYSSNIRDVDTDFIGGSIKYNIEAFYMNKLDGDERLLQIKNKIDNGVSLNEKEILELTFVPLMKSVKTPAERAMESIRVANNISDSNNKLKCLSMLYALLDKFGDDELKEKVWEMFNVTEIGKLIREEGKKEGIKEGIKEGKSETLIRLLTKKFGKVSEEYKAQLRKLAEDTIDIITIDIFEIKDITEIEKYF